MPTTRSPARAGTRSARAARARSTRSATAPRADRRASPPGRPADSALSGVFVSCSCGRRHWGQRGAAGLLLTDPGRTGVVLQLRSARVHHGGTWALMGGAIERGEDPASAALREAHE